MFSTNHACTNPNNSERIMFAYDLVLSCNSREPKRAKLAILGELR